MATAMLPSAPIAASPVGPPAAAGARIATCPPGALGRSNVRTQLGDLGLRRGDFSSELVELRLGRVQFGSQLNVPGRQACDHQDCRDRRDPEARGASSGAFSLHRYHLAWSRGLGRWHDLGTGRPRDRGRSPSRGGLGDGGKHSRLQTLGRLHLLNGLGQVRNDRAKLGKLGMRLGAGGEVFAHGVHLGRRECIENEPGGQIANLIAAHGRHACSPPGARSDEADVVGSPPSNEPSD